MGFKGFRTNVVLRLALFVAFSFVAVWGYANTDWQVTPFVCAAVAGLVLLELIRYVESVNRELTSFLEFVTHDDFSASYPIGPKGRVFKDLESAYRLLLDKYRNLNQAKELNHRYLESLVEHVSVALICLDDAGRVTLMNREAKRLFRVPHLNELASLHRIDPNLPVELSALTDGDRILVRLPLGGETMQLALYVTVFKLLDRSFKLISFQNIRDELEQREVDFSQKLIKVLTHEIMNSVTPIIALCKVIEESLTETVAGDGGIDALALPDAEDLRRSVASIQSRGDGLLRFVQAYRSLTSLPKPNRRRVDVADLLEQTAVLMGPSCEDHGITLSTRIRNSELAIEADPEQIQQVLINLVQNAIDALDGRGNGTIALSGARDENDRITISIRDNGPGIDEGQIDNIFVPFFTTKQRGTGVGLSVSRQVMFLNRGLISVNSTPDRGSEFTLQFRAA